MTSAPASTSALVADSSGDETELSLRDLPLTDLGTGDVLVAVAWSSVNYKDGLASTKRGRVARISPLVLGIDLAGTVVEPGTSGLAVGQPVLAHGYDLGVAHHGGYSQYARVPAGWVVPLPSGLTARQAMTLGTAGFTAALSVLALEDHGLEPGAGPVLVTGATGGVGSVAVSILAARGHQVAAVTGKADAHDWLRALGATDVIDRGAVADASRPLNKETWAGAVDCVGGDVLASVVSSLRYGAAVAASGNTAGTALPTTVFPFILRGVALLGIDSVQCPIDRRREVWQRLATDLLPPTLDQLASSEVALDAVPDALSRILAGGSRGRVLVRIA
ncbi:putative quinone oxidoreductase, YhdH/YhfP family [Modestobacter sp. DSM 44400]|uniref:oxidoreductase n=1 Tax=Modestobacter sp. DSM 44400 TaxID=1550230 RepID=UPI00089CB03C|nr:oxidoreductase [Modestobacter sp. DSM 44400]SDY56560.1 putative quinone oxidoreductase, YhdH/YhfP family [Modestobacter sp. DSM 44400]